MSDKKEDKEDSWEARWRRDLGVLKLGHPLEETFCLKEENQG